MNPNEKLTYIAHRFADLHEERRKRLAVEEFQEEWLAKERKKSVRRDKAQFRARYSSGSSRHPPPTLPDSDFGKFVPPAKKEIYISCSNYCDYNMLPYVDNQIPCTWNTEHFCTCRGFLPSAEPAPYHRTFTGAGSDTSRRGSANTRMQRINQDWERIPRRTATSSRLCSHLYISETYHSNCQKVKTNGTTTPTSLGYMSIFWFLSYRNQLSTSLTFPAMFCLEYRRFTNTPSTSRAGRTLETQILSSSDNSYSQ